jgi:hypothetical protein
MKHLFGAIRERSQAVTVFGIGAALMLVVGVVLAFVIAPYQALEWRRIDKMPALDADGVAAAAVGEKVVVTGILSGNASLTIRGFAAYELDMWVITPSQNERGSSRGSWQFVKREVPALTLDVDGQSVRTMANNNASLDGANLHEYYEDGTGSEQISYHGRFLSHGASRWRGFWDGDTVTVVGQKASTGDVTPAHLFMGDRAQLVEHIRSGSKGTFIGGIACMIGSPVAFILGMLGVVFDRRHRGL